MTDQHLMPPDPMVDPTWPKEVGLIMSALEAGQWQDERRKLQRVPYRVTAYLQLFTDASDAEEKMLYTRDVHSRGMGFLTNHRLPLGYGGAVRIMSPQKQELVIRCTLLRCRQAAGGWYEGAIHFIREQSAFDPTEPW